MNGDGEAAGPLDQAKEMPLGLPRGSVRSLMSLGVVVAAAAIAGFLLAEDASSDLTKIAVGAGSPPWGT